MCTRTLTLARTHARTHTHTYTHTHTHTHAHTQQDGVRDVLSQLPSQDPSSSPSSPSASQLVSLSSSQLEQFELSQQQHLRENAEGSNIDHPWGFQSATVEATSGATDFVSVSELCDSTETSGHLPRKRPCEDDSTSKCVPLSP